MYIYILRLDTHVSHTHKCATCIRATHENTITGDDID